MIFNFLVGLAGNFFPSASSLNLSDYLDALADVIPVSWLGFSYCSSCIGTSLCTSFMNILLLYGDWKSFRDLMHQLIMRNLLSPPSSLTHPCTCFSPSARQVLRILWRLILLILNFPKVRNHFIYLKSRPFCLLRRINIPYVRLYRKINFSNSLPRYDD